MAASEPLGEACPSSVQLPAGWSLIDAPPLEPGTAAAEPEPEPLEQQRYDITELGRHALAQARALERGPSVAEVMARATRG